MAQRVVRLLPGGMDTEIAAQHTRPFKLVRIEFRAPVGTRYYSTGPEVVLEAQTYVAHLIDVGELSWGPDGDQQGQIELYNESEANTAAALVLSARVAETPITIYDAYMTLAGSYVAVKTAVGVLTDSSLTPASATVSMVTNNMGAERLPNRPVTYAEGFHWLPPAGSMLVWGNETYVFEEEN